MPAWRIDRPFDYAIPESLAAVVVEGSLVRVPFGGRRVRGVVVGIGIGTDSSLAEIAALVFPAPVAPPPHDRLLDWIARRYVAPRGRTFALAVPPRVRVSPSAPTRGPGGPEPKRIADYQGGASLVEGLSQKSGGVWCVQSLAGEDRGALIAELVAAATSSGGSALVAVPEVRYGSQVIERLTEEWPQLARLDSGVPDRQRSQAWADLGGGARLGAGGRAAVLAPARDLRLVVIDEDHHPTYKEERSPRYDARRVGLERSRIERAACAIVGATPSVEIGYLALTGGARWVAPDREAARRARPIVEVIERPTDRAVSHELHSRVRDVLHAGGRVALLAPRRGYSRALWCAACRRSVRCPRCEAGMGFDRGARRLRCPRCGNESEPPDRCPSCGAVEWRYMGAGSERLADQIASMWPRARVARMDPDVIRGAEGAEIQRADIYVTTWIGTKPGLRPEVNLVGVLDADTLIRRPDFRSGEHAYQALAEMAEWAGPASSEGRLMIQTAEPRHHAIQAVVRADYRFFLERELAIRKELAYPPFSELIKITATGTDAEDTLGGIADICRRQGARVLGPIGRDGEKGPTLQILCKCRSAEAVAAHLRPHVADLRPSARVAIDVDPR